MLAVNFAAFPFTPEEIGVPCVYGPAAGVWYMVTSILALRSLRWVDQAMGQ